MGEDTIQRIAYIAGLNFSNIPKPLQDMLLANVSLTEEQQIQFDTMISTLITTGNIVTERISLADQIKKVILQHITPEKVAELTGMGLRVLGLDKTFEEALKLPGGTAKVGIGLISTIATIGVTIYTITDNIKMICKSTKDLSCIRMFANQLKPQISTVKSLYSQLLQVFDQKERNQITWEKFFSFSVTILKEILKQLLLILQVKLPGVEARIVEYIKQAEEYKKILQDRAIASAVSSVINIGSAVHAACGTVNALTKVIIALRTVEAAANGIGLATEVAGFVKVRSNLKELMLHTEMYENIKNDLEGMKNNAELGLERAEEKSELLVLSKQDFINSERKLIDIEDILDNASRGIVKV